MSDLSLAMGFLRQEQLRWQIIDYISADIKKNVYEIAKTVTRALSSVETITNREKRLQNGL